MSQRFLPMIRHLESRGLLTTCWGEITGSAVAAKVRIDAIGNRYRCGRLLQAVEGVSGRLADQC
ncbi:hypothetical protein [Nocardia sp. NPDC004750]